MIHTVNVQDLQNIGDVYNGITIWNYNTNDTYEDVNADGYFNPAYAQMDRRNKQMCKGDIIIVNRQQDFAPDIFLVTDRIDEGEGGIEVANLDAGKNGVAVLSVSFEYSGPC